MIALVKFDLVIGPQVWKLEIMRGSRLIKQLENPVTLAEVYMGYARTDVEILELLNEKVVLARHYGDAAETDTPSLLFVSCIKTAKIDRVRSLAGVLMHKTKADTKKFDSAMRSAIREDKSVASAQVEVQEQKFTVDANTIVKRGDEFKNVHGFIFVDTKFHRVDARFMSKWVGATKIDAYEITKHVLSQKANFARRKKAITLLYKGLELLVVESDDKEARGLAIVMQKEGSTTASSVIAFWLGHLLSVMHAAPNLQKKPQSIIRALAYIETFTDKFIPRHTGKELLSIVLEADALFPELVINERLINSFEMPVFSPENGISADLLRKFDGKHTLIEICEETSVSCHYLAFLVLFCVSRGIAVLLRGKPR